LHTATAFSRLTLLGGIAQEILQCPHHKRTKSSAIPIGTVKELTFKHHEKKILGQILSVGNGMTLVTNESKNRSPINFAKFRQCFAHLLLAAFRIRAG
jgi:hypothetical protein